MRKPDGTGILIDDIASVGFRTYRRLVAGTNLPTGINMVSPLPGGTARAGSRVLATAGGIARTQSWNFTLTASTTFNISLQRSCGLIDIVWSEPGVVLQESTDLVTWTDLTTATSPYRPTGPRPYVFYRLKK